jgi:uncharacterized protein DUF1592/uncharacterized protein DUF1588/uncharacterized protein DUF1595/uncharacterized protein DUF1587/uncharacterized protein DUF1585
MRPRDLRRLRAPVLVVLALAGAACNHPLAPKATGSAGAGGATGLAGAAGGTGITGTGGDVAAIPDGGQPLDQGRPALRRLTNLEYDDTIRDLLGVAAQAQATFLPEELSGEFDVIGDGQSWSDARFEQYANAAETLSAAAFADPTLRARIVTCQPAAPGDTACTRTIVTAFGLRAWRRPLTDDETTGLIAVANAALADGATFEVAIQRVVTALLSSAPFLMHVELDPMPSSTVAHALTGYELASRLSYLLWSSMPDDRLFQLAGGGLLVPDSNLESEVDRMLADPRADGFVEGFAVQWLQADRLASLLLDPMVDATFDQPLRDAMGQEMRLYFGAFLSDDRDFRTFPSADINFVNDRLAILYGMTPPGSDTLARVTNTADARAGFLGLGGFLAMTSVSGRSSPTARGQWVLSHLLCSPTPPPTPGTPDVAPGQPLNGIALAASVGAQPVCATCHATMDGVGLALEPFDEMGRLRATYRDGTPIDGKGTFFGKTVVGEPALATAVSADPRLLVCASREVMSFAVNRTLGDSDALYAKQILTQWTGGTPTLRALIKAVVTNDTFKFRHGEAP